MFRAPVGALVALGLCACKRPTAENRKPDGGTISAPSSTPAVVVPEDGESFPADGGEPDARDIRRVPLEPAEAGTCHAPLEDWCNGPCSTHQAALTNATKKARDIPCGRGGLEAGECGELLYVELGGGFETTTEFFAKDGHLIGAVKAADAQLFCGGRSSDITFGTVPRCVRKATMKKKPCSTKGSSFKCMCGDPLCTSASDCVR